MNTSKLKTFFANRTVRLVLILLAALLLLFGIYKVFFGGKKAAYTPTEQEARLAELLTQVEDVKQATVMIAEEDGAPVSAVIVFEGQDGFLTRMRIAKMAANALHITEKQIAVYPAS